MTLLINLLTAFGIVIAIYCLILLGVAAIYFLGFAGQFDDLGFKKDDAMVACRFRCPKGISFGLF